MQELKGKKVLLFMPSFFGYEIEIKKELENLGASVHHYDERPKNDFFTKVFIRLNLKSLVQNKINKYYQDITESNKDEKFNYLFLVNPETIDKEKISKIKEYHPDIKIFIYMWDSIKNKKKSLDLLSYSDNFFTFDKEDNNIDRSIKFLPLFYIDAYKDMKETKKYKYDFAFIGTIHSDRYNTIKKIENFSKRNNLKTYFYFYSPSKVLFFFQKLFKKDFKLINKNDISFSSMNTKNIINIIKESKIIIDIHHPLQSGLTMRSIEMLGAKRKLLTTNENIIDYDFYNSKNIRVFDRNKIDIDIDFIKSESYGINDEIYKSYSINNWLKKIFKGKTK